MILTIKDPGFRVSETTCLGCFDYRQRPTDPWPPSGGNHFSIRYLSTEGDTKYASCANARYENFEILSQLYPDLQITVNGGHMRITDPRVGPEWLYER